MEFDQKLKGKCKGDQENRFLCIQMLKVKIGSAVAQKLESLDSGHTEVSINTPYIFEE